MNKLPQYFSAIATTAWVGSLWAVGYLAVPILFHAQPDKQLAGLVAGQMFNALGYVGLFAGAYLLLFRLSVSGKRALREPMFIVVTAMLIISLTIQFGIQPWLAHLKSQVQPLDVMQSSNAGHFKLWHGISSILYLIESLLGACLLIIGKAVSRGNAESVD
jgi:hypothetical protein